MITYQSLLLSTRQALGTTQKIVVVSNAAYIVELGYMFCFNCPFGKARIKEEDTSCSKQFEELLQNNASNKRTIEKTIADHRTCRTHICSNIKLTRLS